TAIGSQESSRWSAMLLATVVAIITCLAVANATQTITTPNAAFFSYNLAPGASSAAITLPASSRSVFVMGCNNESIGVGQVSLFHLPGAGMGWVGLESWGLAGTTTTTTAGLGGSAGTHIVYIDVSHLLDIQVASRDTILIHNNIGALPRTGNVTLIW